MDPAVEKKIVRLMRKHNVMTLATVRPDGYPQATTVTFASDGLDIYFGCDKSAQKVKNIRQSNRISLTIDRDDKDWSRIKGLSPGGRAEILPRGKARQHALELLQRKFPQWADLSPEDLAGTALVRVKPEVISMRVGFGHTDLVRV